MRLTLVILCFFLLLHKSNSNASAARSGHTVAIKAFVLERKKSEAAPLAAPTKLSRVDNLGAVSQLMLWDCEETEEDGFVCDVKFKVLSSFYLTLSPLYQIASGSLNPEVTTYERLNSQILCAKYLAQRSLRI